MIKNNYLFLLLAFILVCASCSKKNTSQAYWEDAPVVAERVMVEGNELIKLNPDLLTDTIVFPLSYFTEELEIIKLDDRDEALVSPQQKAIISDNYILILAEQNNPCKLFDRNGMFISDIGGVGNGPGEYRNVRSYHLDEANNRIYLFGGYSSSILVYDFAGKVLDPITLPRQLTECAFRVKGDLVEIVAKPNDQPQTIAWMQTLNGEMLDSIPAEHLTLNKGAWALRFYSDKQEDLFATHFMTLPGRADTLYHIDFNAMKVIPRFMMDYSNREMQPHSYEEWKDYFVGSTSEQIHIVTMSEDGTSDRRTEGEKPAHYIVDKKTLKGNCFRIENDFMVGQDIVYQPVYLFENGYFVRNVDPGNLEEMLEKMLQSEALSDSMRKKFTRVQEQMGDDDNNYILYARVK
ncbi:hypothetical protein M2137_000639 [Parabacteroides sp. PFB2-10]|uniref:6-bladed beta-propeller n=1 Tax=Parabacteroides sp. PFB2-10 TaxID=1742405 RepID=UPI002474747F|nr:6-bladed beta-propeller [Parabacteroides sp. PFB2-10]MDH6311880.1 hypothetical protein [Parabacteroides sp. PFB2-10]